MKQTEIGLIPDDWEVKRLGEIGEPCMCKRILKEQTSPTGDIPFYKIGTFGGIPDAFISRDLFEQYKEQYNYPRKGTLLLSAAGTIGRVVVFDGKDSYFQDSNIVWIDNDETKVTNDFLFYCYSRMQWKTEEGGIVSRLYNANLKSTSFIAPKSLAEQQRIAKALSDVDALISTTEKLIQKKKNIKQGTMQNLLTGKKRLPGFTKSSNYKQTEIGLIPEDWEVKSLGDIFSIKHGYGFEGQFFSHQKITNI
ncbi:MAG: restriction endonuclease subunit S [Treponema succinifaciens]|nr:MAG: restriction endonuclease subunit S [Treponema succinifaciens]